MSRPRGSWAARLLWWPILRGAVGIGLALTGVFLAAFAALTAAVALFRGVPIAGPLALLASVSVYLALFLVYGVVFAGLAIVSLIAVRQGLIAARPEFMRPPGGGPRPRRNVDARVSDVDTP